MKQRWYRVMASRPWRSEKYEIILCDSPSIYVQGDDELQNVIKELEAKGYSNRKY